MLKRLLAFIVMQTSNARIVERLQLERHSVSWECSDMTNYDTDADKRQVTAEGTWHEGSASWWEAIAIKRAGAIKDLESELKATRESGKQLADEAITHNVASAMYNQVEGERNEARRQLAASEKQSHAYHEQLTSSYLARDIMEERYKQKLAAANKRADEYKYAEKMAQQAREENAEQLKAANARIVEKDESFAIMNQAKNRVGDERDWLKEQLKAANDIIIEREKGLKVYNDENQELVDVINEELRVKEPHSPKQLVRLAGERLAGALALVGETFPPNSALRDGKQGIAPFIDKIEKLLRGVGSADGTFAIVAKFVSSVENCTDTAQLRLLDRFVKDVKALLNEDHASIVRDWDMIEPLVQDRGDVKVVQALDRLRFHFGHPRPVARPQKG